jgi:ankyrin repeat protein
MNVNPGSINDQENFSWKYYQALPLTKKQLYHLYILNNLFSIFPIIYWITCFHVHLARHVLEVEPYDIQKWFPAGLLLLVWMSTLLFSHLVSYPRLQFTKLNKRILFYQNIRNFIFIFFGCLFGVLFLGVLYKYLSQFQPGLLKKLEVITPYVWNGKFGLLILFLLMLYSYFNNFRDWLDEEKNTPKINWNSKWDIPLMVLSVGLIYVPFSLLSVSRDGGLALHEAIINNNMQEFELLVRQKEEINEKNQFGFTPIMTAAKRGRGDMFKVLLEKGASLDGIALISKDEEMDIFRLAIIGGDPKIVEKVLTKENVQMKWNGISPLHIASSRCYHEVADLILENGAKINDVDNEGQTALHRASKSNCFPVTAILLENGADPLIKDKKNKLAHEYGDRSNRSPAAFIERKAKKIFRKSKRALAGPLHFSES